MLEMIFGADGLKPSLLKMFLDPFHQDRPGPSYRLNDERIDMSAYDHRKTTRSMRYFAREGLALTRNRGGDLSIVTTMYGPPGWMTLQRFVRGRDLDPALKVECAKYMISWARYLRDVEKLPVRYISLHNEGEDWLRWPDDGAGDGDAGHDHNLYWPAEQVVEFLKLMRQMLDRAGMKNVGLTCGETTFWTRFDEWGYADAIADDEEALGSMALVTSHGFWCPGFCPWNGDFRSCGIDLIRRKRPDIHAWVTSASWSKMDAYFACEVHNNIYSTKTNGFIPWACVQREGLWIDGDPNPGTAFRVNEGRFTVEKGYYFYKQLCRAGQAGMAVARVMCNDSQQCLLAFASNGTANPDALVVANIAERDVPLDIEVAGTESGHFEAWRTSPSEDHVHAGVLPVSNGVLRYVAPPGSVTTFYGA